MSRAVRLARFGERGGKKELKSSREAEFVQVALVFCKYDVSILLNGWWAVQLQRSETTAEGAGTTLLSSCYGGFSDDERI